MAIDRRAFLGALALAPATLAACATGAGSAGGERTALPSTAPSGEPAGGVLAAVREFPLGASVEPAHVFRAAAAKP